MNCNYFLVVCVMLLNIYTTTVIGSNDINWNWNSTIDKNNNNNNNNNNNDNINNNNNNNEIPFSETQILKWTNLAMKFLQDFHLCLQSNIGSEDECFKLSSTVISQVAIYMGYDKKRIHKIQQQIVTNNSNGGGNGQHFYKSSEEIRSLLLINGNTGSSSLSTVNAQTTQSQLLQNLLRERRKVFAVLPDSNSIKSSGAHDVILALDPYPYANFGHLIGLFYIDFNVDARFCKEEHQIYIFDQTCITVARKPRCPNILERHVTGYHPRRCHIDFLPTVHLNVGSASDVQNLQTSVNLLDCVTMPGFASCPRLRPIEETTQILCDATHTNSKRCDTSYSGVGTRCKLFQTCDRAILIGGGWNRLHSNLHSLENIFNLEEMLINIGFQSENIKMFYANGKNSKNQGSSTTAKPTSYFSSGMKTGIRGHIRTICETRHCADTLFIYLNNPTTVEGDFLLWDMDKNGIADDLEIYTAKEFLSDISRCEAKRIIVVVDQSNSNILLSTLKQSNEHQNVYLFTSGSLNQIITNGELTNVLLNSTHSTSCLNNFEEAAKLRMRDSNPSMYDSSGGTISQLSMIGAPCDLNPPLQERELKSLYQGCQNIPTSIWFSLNYSEVHEDEDEIDEKESNENSPSNRRNQ